MAFDQSGTRKIKTIQFDEGQQHRKANFVFIFGPHMGFSFHISSPFATKVTSKVTNSILQISDLILGWVSHARSGPVDKVLHARSVDNVLHANNLGTMCSTLITCGQGTPC